MKRLKDVALGILILLFGCVLAGGTIYSIVQFAQQTDGTVVRVQHGKQPSIRIATADGEVSVPFSADDEALCPPGARFHKAAWSAERRCNGRVAASGAGAILWWLGIVVGGAFSSFAIWLGVSRIGEGLRGKRPRRAKASGDRAAR